MAFANLFTRLSAVEEDVKNPAQTASALRNGCDNGKRCNPRKRKPQGEQTGSFKKKQCYQARMGTYNAASFEWNNQYMQNTGSVHASCSFTKELTNYQSNKAGYKKTHHQGPNCTAKNNHNVNKPQHQTKKMERQKNQHQMKNRWKQTNHTRQARIGRGNRKYEDGKREAQVKRERFMTQEFKDQNALMRDGQLLCRHFLWGRCIKGDECQLKHIQSCNDLIKEVCKFYIQGFCTRGESCPYMHKSFPCKFFHSKGKCSQDPDCRFSHEPLNEVTNQLLEEAIKRERELNELQNKTAQESSGQQVTKDESVTASNQTPDLLIPPLRPRFYNSEETIAEQKALLCPAEEQSSDSKEAVPPQPPPQHLPSAESNNQEPVCYSVEAVLGRPLFKPFPNFCTTPKSQESTFLSVEKSPESTPDSVPYSVDAVLRSCKSAKSSTFGSTPTCPAPQTISYNPKSDCAEITDPLLGPDPQNEKVLCSVSCRTEETNAQARLFKSLPSNKTSPNSTLQCRDLGKQGEMPESQKPAQTISREVKLELLHSPAGSEKSFKSKGIVKTSSHLPTDTTWCVNCKSEGCNCKSLRCSPKYPTQPKSHVSGLTSNPEASVKTLSPPGFTEFKGKAALSAEPITRSAKTPDSVHFQQLPEIHRPSEETESELGPGTQQQASDETKAANCSSNMATCRDLSGECNKTPKRLFQSLFTSPITDSLKPTTNSVTTPASCQTSVPTRQSEHCSNDTHVRTAVEPYKTSTRAFFNLFASPLSAALLAQPDYIRTTSCSQGPDESIAYTSNLSDSNQRASKLETSLSCKIKSRDKPTCHLSSYSKLSTNHKDVNADSLSETVEQPKKQQVNPICSLVSDSLSTSSSPAPCANHPDRFTNQSQQQQPSMLSQKSSAAAATTNSVLKTLFLHLSPYQQDGEQQDSLQINLPSEGERDDSRMGSVVKEKRKSEKKGRGKKELETQDSLKQSHEKTPVPSTEQQKSFQNTRLSLEATNGSTLCSPTRTEPQLRNFGTHNSPFKAVMPPMQHHPQLRLK
ncbi:Zinc finger CCCH domain-containing protein 6 [Channa argus]|uniref:Zinc finger CCCH domain-containing protein 6 n=1 Tax=Channa argus TaxID=215402 RepID=A0A6G1PA78_CHAAH|nr:Zinc finger CCCH domain-containing protein 6 [Channa argus]